MKKLDVVFLALCVFLASSAGGYFVGKGARPGVILSPLCNKHSGAAHMPSTQPGGSSGRQPGGSSGGIYR